MRSTPLRLAVALLLLTAACGLSAESATPVRPTTSVTPLGPGSGEPVAPSIGDNGFPADWTPKPLAWSACKEDRSAQCARMTVPRDWSEPNGETIELAVARYKAKGRKIGSLLMNPGGPGGSGIDFLLAKVIDTRLASRFDLVSWDPRGVAKSTPLACRSKVGPFLALDPDPDDAAEQSAIDDAAKAVADQCGQLDGDLLSHLGTDDVARDLEALRIALDDPQLSYMGFSYGTFIGTRYAALFPTHIRAMVLDGPLDPTEDLADGLAGQAAAFDAAISKAFRSCTPATSCPVPDLAVAYDELHTRVEQAPMTGTGGRVLGPASLATGAVYVAYDQTLWPDLANGIGAALDGDPDPMLDLADGYYDLSNFTAYTAVECIDSATPKGSAEWTAFASRLEAISPRFGGSIANELLPCAFWPAPPVDTTGIVDASGAPPIMVIGNTGDPATPYPNAQKLAGMLDQGRLVTYRGEGHTSYGRDQCIDDIVDRYLIELDVPESDPACGDG